MVYKDSEYRTQYANVFDFDSCEGTPYFAVAFLGYGEDRRGFRDTYVAGIFESLEDLAINQVAHFDFEGDEWYLIVPRYKDYVTLTNLETGEKHTIYHGEAFTVKCNLSDLHSNIEISTEDSRGHKFSPQIGGDGRFVNCFNWLSGRYLHISGVSEAPGCGDILAMSISNVGKRSGFFSGDETLERIMKLDADTFVANTISGVTMDCPHRERLGYGETGCSTTWGVGLPLFDCADLYYGYLPAWASRIESNGHIPHVAPDFWGGGGTQWSNYPVIGLADMLNKYPDKRLCEELRPVLLAYFEFLASQCRDGLLRRYEQEEWGFLGDWATPEGDDWGSGREALFFNNCCYAYAITRALEAGIFDAETAHGLTKRHKELCVGINREFYRDGLYCSEHARYQAAAIICGAADSRREAVYERMLGIIGKKGYLDGGSAGLSLMFRVLAADRRGRSAAIKCLRRREYPGYLYFVDQGQTTLPEMWDMRDIYGGSRIHTCYSGVSGFIMRGLAGIDFKAGKAIIEPFISSELPEFSAQEDTLWGTLSVECRVSGQRAAVSIWVPSGCAAEFVHEGRRTVLQSGLNCFEQDCAE